MTEKKKTEKELSIEETLGQLEKINTQLSSETLPLEEALTLYATGAELVSASIKKLENAKLKMEEITLVMQENKISSEEIENESDGF